MKLIDRILGRKNDEPRQRWSSVDTFSFMFDTENLTTPQGQAREGYRNNPYVYRACNYWGIFASLPETLIQDAEGNELEDHPLTLLFKRPNPKMSRTEFFKTIGTHLGIYGESFVYPIRTVRGIEELYVMDPIDVSVVETGDPWYPVLEYRFNRGSAGMMVLKPEDIIHIRLYNPDRKGARGMSPLVAAKRSIEMQNSIRDWNISTTRNGAKTSLVIKVPHPLSDQQFDDLENQMREKHSGRNNAGSGMILDDGKDAVSLGMTAVEMDFIQGLIMGAREVSITMGVASEMLGDAQNKTYSNMLEANRQTMETTGKPIVNTIYEALTIGLLLNPVYKNPYPEVAKITYDPEQMNDITVDKEAMYTVMEQATYLTINEKREKLGYDPIEDPMADVPLVNMGLGPLSDVGLDNEPFIGDETPYLTGDGTITENLARMENGKEQPKEESMVEYLAKLGQ